MFNSLSSSIQYPGERVYRSADIAEHIRQIRPGGPKVNTELLCCMN